MPLCAGGCSGRWWVLLVLFAVWSNYPFIPNPWAVLFRQPVGDTASVSTPHSWAMYGANPQNTNYIADTQPLEGVVAYTVEVHGDVRSAPAVSGGRVYIGGQSRIAAYETESGDLLWERQVNGPAHGTPAVTGGDSGLVLPRPARHQRPGPRPALRPHRLGIRRRLAVSRHWSQSMTASCTARRAADTSTPWTPRPATSCGRWTPAARWWPPVAVHDGRMFAASTVGVLYIRNAGTGDKRARIRTGSAIVNPPVVDGERVFLLLEGDLLSFDNTIREMPGRYPAELIWAQLWIWGFPLPPPPEHAGLQWRVSPTEGLGDFAHPPTVTPEALYLGTDLGVVLALGRDTGDVLWQMEAAPPATAADGPPGKVASPVPHFLPPVVAPVLAAGDLLLLAYADDTIRAVNRFTHEEEWTLLLGSQVVAPLSYADGTVYAHTQDGKLHAIR